MNRRIELSVNGTPAMETYVTGTGQVLTVHARTRCVGEWCVIHARMPGHTQSWPTHWRSGWGGFMEVVCPHNVGHPAPEGFRADDAHGCDGCCRDVYTIDGEIVEPMKELG